MVRGNYWAHGIPGFGANSFSALTGDYRIDGLSDGTAGQEELSVYLTAETLYFSGDWQQRDTGDIRTFQQTSAEGFFTAAVLDDGRGNNWTAVFRFPRALAEAGFSIETYNLIIRAWTQRFLYFISLTKNPQEFSLPAVVEF